MDIFAKLFAVKDAFPDMRWYTEDGVLKMEVWINSDNEEMLSNARRMFS